MKVIGLIGGMSWESTALYYRGINEGVKARLGGLHSARMVLYSVDFQEIEALQQAGNWDRAGDILAKVGASVEAAGADFILLCTNTMHRVAAQVEAAVSIPLLHLADATADRILSRRMKIVGLLGTAFTMEEDFYRGRLENQGIEVLIPGAEDRAIVHRVIYEELCRGQIRDVSRTEYLRIIDSLGRQGAQGVIAGCTEIGLLVGTQDTPMTWFDTTAIHVAEAVRWALD